MLHSVLLTNINSNVLALPLFRQSHKVYITIRLILYRWMKLTNTELSDIYERINKNKEFAKKTSKQILNYINRIGFIIVIFSIIPIIPIILQTFFKINLLYLMVAGLFIGSILMNVSNYIGKPWPPKLSINEKQFLKVFESLKDIETYQKDNDDYSRIEAKNKLSKVKREMKESQERGNYFWRALMKENIDCLNQLKSNFEDRLFPNLIKGTDEDLMTAYSIIEKFAKYLLNPTISELKELNRSLSDLNSYPQEKSQIKTQIGIFFGHPYIVHFFVLILLISSSYFVFHIGIKQGASIDTAYLGEIGFFGTLTAAYLIIIKR